MAAPTLSDYINKQGKQVKNLQKFLSYYGELYQYYSDQGLPDNKFMYFLEENTYTNGYSTIPPEITKFMSLRPDQIAFLTPYVRLYKKFTAKNSKVKILEFPFENKTDFSSYNDPQGYINNDFPFVSERFLGPTALLQDFDIRYDGIRGKGATPADANAVTVSFSVIFQDPKLLFKNWGDTNNQLQYKDLFAQPSGNNSYRILLELGYNVPDDPSMDIKDIAKYKSVFELIPNAPGTKFNYQENGELKLDITLRGFTNDKKDEINILDQKYYTNVMKKNNMLVLNDDIKTSVARYEKRLGELNNLKLEREKQLNNLKATAEKVNKKDSVRKELSEIEAEVQEKRRLVQLAKNIGAVPETFPFISALYEAGQLYYFEMKNETFQSFIRKIADGEPVAVSSQSLVPRRKKNLRPTPEDVVKRNTNKNSFFANTLEVKRFNTDEEEESNLEKIKFFYFGDLINIMLNDKKNTGVGQDLVELGEDSFKFLFGPILWSKNKSTKILYNILSTPISLDMFLFYLNLEVYQKNRKRMSIGEFLAIFMKRFFDTIVLSTEKQKTGEDVQTYSGRIQYYFDKSKFNRGGKFKKNLYEFLLQDTIDTVTVNMITCYASKSRINSITARKRNVPIFYVGGPDRGPLKTLNFSLASIPGFAELYATKQIKANANSDTSIGEVIDSSVLITQRTAVTFSTIGNSFLNLGDYVYVDSRFVDGGFFQQEENLIFFTGYYYIYSVYHSFKRGQWTTTYNANFIPSDINNKAYEAHSGDLPESQDVNISRQAELSRQITTNAPDKNDNSADKATSIKNDSKHVQSSNSFGTSSADPITVSPPSGIA